MGFLMAVLNAEIGIEPEFGGMMAWISFVIGAVAAMVVATLAYAFLALPLWMVLLSYPVIGTLVALAVLLVLFARSEESEAETSETNYRQVPKVRAALGRSDS
ncbi:MAG: hypothetical protein COB16_17515 [Rhodobacteraceae bacterium]|nr:MAG: hypothetical protein COB16_17515 [Paracoccaceae bacterium]